MPYGVAHLNVMQKFRIYASRTLYASAAILVLTSLVPTMLNQMILSALLIRPPFPTFYEPPFAYSDKPIFMTYLGVIITAFLWGFILVLFAWLVSPRKKNKNKET